MSPAPLPIRRKNSRRLTANRLVDISSPPRDETALSTPEYPLRRPCLLILRMVSGGVREGRGREFYAKENLERERRPCHDVPARRHPRADPGVATSSAACLRNSMRHGLGTDARRNTSRHRRPPSVSPTAWTDARNPDAIRPTWS